MSQQTFPNGTTFVRSAQSPEQVATVFQGIVAQLFGYDLTQPASLPAAWNAVRVAWQEQGEPAWGIGEDVCIVRADSANEDFSQIRDNLYAGTALNPTMQETMGYTQIWNVHFTLYGPNCFDRAGLILSGLTLDWIHDQLAAKNLYAVAQWNRPSYIPELFQGQWWKRADIALQYNEQVIETIEVSTAAGVNVTLYPDANPPQTILIEVPA